MTLDWLRQLVGLPGGPRTATSRTRRRPARWPRSPRRDTSPRAGASWSPPSTRTRRSTRPAGCSSSSCARFRSTTRSGSVRTRSTSTAHARSSRPSGRPRRQPVDPVPAIADALRRGGSRGCTSTPRTRARRRSARSCATISRGWERADSHRRQPTQVAGDADGLLGALDAAGRGLPQRPSASCRSTCAHPTTPLNLSEVSVPLGRRFRALKLWAVLRCFGRAGPAGAHPRARPPGASCSRAGCATSPAGRSARRVPFSLVCFRLDARTTT